jgi:hypothetical protein
VDSRLDALIHKVRISFQNTTVRTSVSLVRMSVQQIWKLRIQLQLSGNLPIMVRTRAKQIWKLRVEDQLLGRPSPLVRTGEALYENYLQRTCDRPDDSTSPFGLSNRKDFQQKYQKFWSHSCPSGRLMSTVRMASVLITAVARLNPQPINRGPWALRTARIRY